MSGEEMLLARIFQYEYIPPVPIPKRCRVCCDVLDEDYQKRGRGRLCLECFREYRRWIVDCGAIAKYAHQYKHECSIEGCHKEGVRHHPDYSKPDEIVWLCHHHHTLEHRRA